MSTVIPYRLVIKLCCLAIVVAGFVAAAVFLSTKAPEHLSKPSRAFSVSDIDVFGETDVRQKYVVISTTSDWWSKDSLNFIFQLPLTVLAWKRVGFNSVVIVVGSADVWQSDSLLYFVFSSVRALEAVVIFIKAQPENAVMISQVSRLFAASILRDWLAAASDISPLNSVYLVTSDADIWPISRHFFDASSDTDVTSFNAFCCSPFVHDGVSYRMLPLSNIGMRIGTWADVMNSDQQPMRSASDILAIVVRVFGESALRPVQKGENPGWYMDQRLVSIVVKQFTDRRGENRVKLVGRNTRDDRIDRIRWSVDDTALTKFDAHLPLDSYLPSVWSSILPLVRVLFGPTTGQFNWTIAYQQKFMKLVKDKNETVHQR